MKIGEKRMYKAIKEFEKLNEREQNVLFIEITLKGDMVYSLTNINLNILFLRVRVDCHTVKRVYCF